jgi:3-methyladenine DNA glycosylase AlkC
MAEPFLIRDFFSPAIVKKIATDISRENTSFDEEGFLNAILSQLRNQSYSERKDNITQNLIYYLPEDYETSVKLLLKVTPPPYTGEMETDGIDRFYVSTFTSFISKQGLDHYDISMNALYEMTKCFTSEWDIRPFILAYPEKTLSLLKIWAKDKNLHVRRLVSEGSRPNLPWGKKLKFIDENAETTTLPLLSILQNDHSEYVRRSVANHLNDLSKNNADLVVKHLEKWSTNKPSKNKTRLIHHALRTLIKQGHIDALKLIGYEDDFNVDVKISSGNSDIKWGGKFEFSFIVKSNESNNRKLLIDYIIGFQKKDGKISNKVFKLKKVELTSKEEIVVSKSQSFKAITTRVYYPGKHILYIQINGKIVAQKTFQLLKS